MGRYGVVKAPLPSIGHGCPAAAEPGQKERPISQANNDSTGFGAPVHIDTALIEAKRQVRDLLTEANKVPSDNDATDAVKQDWGVIDWMADCRRPGLSGRRRYDRYCPPADTAARH